MPARRRDIDVARLVDLYLSGLSSREVGRELGLSPRIVLLRLREGGVRVRPMGRALGEACTSPECTGMHGSTVPASKRCPAATERINSWAREWSRDADPRRLGFANRAERDEYLAQGCAIGGCDRPAVHVDHDHFVCPQKRHSCERCRRGPLCWRHNTTTIALIDRLRDGGLQAELDYLGLSVTFAQLATEVA